MSFFHQPLLVFNHFLSGLVSGLCSLGLRFSVGGGLAAGRVVVVEADLALLGSGGYLASAGLRSNPIRFNFRNLKRNVKYYMVYG